MALFGKKHHVQVVYDVRWAKPMHPPKSLLTCALIVGTTDVPIWIDRAHLQELTTDHSPTHAQLPPSAVRRLKACSDNDTSCARD